MNSNKSPPKTEDEIENQKVMVERGKIASRDVPERQQDSIMERFFQFLNSLCPSIFNSLRGWEFQKIKNYFQNGSFMNINKCLEFFFGGVLGLCFEKKFYLHLEDFWTSLKEKLNLSQYFYRLQSLGFFQQYKEEEVYHKGIDHSTIQYYSQDSPEFFKIKISIQKINTLTGKVYEDLENNSYKKKEKNIDVLEKYKNKNRENGTEKFENFLSKLRKSNSNSQNRNEDDENSQNFSLVLNWQQKVFSPREFAKYYSESFSPDNEIDEVYKLKIKELAELISLTEKKNKKTLQSYNQVQRNSKSQPKFGFKGFRDLLEHRIFSYVEQDSFYTDDLFEGIKCNSNDSLPKEKQKESVSSLSEKEVDSEFEKKEQNSSDSVSVDIQETIKKHKSILNEDEKCQTMYIMVNFGKYEANEKTGDFFWEGEEYCICKIKVYPDGTFDMKPGFSVLPSLDGKDPNSINKYREKLEQIEKIGQKKKNYYLITSNYETYQFTIDLYNDLKRDHSVDILRKDILKKMYDKTFGMKRNIFGIDFAKPPQNENEIRYHVFGKVLSARNFSNNGIFINYKFDFDPAEIRILDNQEVSGSTHVSIPSRQSHFFDSPFEFHFLAKKNSPSNPILYFEVIEVDFWDRYRYIGYGYCSIPFKPGKTSRKISTWKPSGSLKRNFNDCLMGGEKRIDDLSYVSVPKDKLAKEFVFEQFKSQKKDSYLNKFGFSTIKSGNIFVEINLIKCQQIVKKITKRNRRQKKL